MLAVLAAIPIALDRRFPPDLSRLASVGGEVLDRDGRLLAVRPAPGGVWRLAASPDQVSPAFLDLLIGVEDRRFWWHPGVDPLGLLRAAVQWARAGHVVSGGSTLAMQAARLLEPRPRTLRSKLIEIARAVQLEAHFGRRGVLGIWLTLAPFGGNLEGVRAAALAWFGVPADALDPARSALLVAIPRRPEALRPDRHPEAARALRDRILALGGGYDSRIDSAIPVPARRLPTPCHAPQIVATLPPAPVLTTTLDLPLQAALERLAEAQLRALPERASLALLIADSGTRAIRAVYAGGWGEVARAGSLDLTRARRSPGSALKPFIYGLAFADGTLGPETVLTDLPRRFGRYAPENFDRGFAGRITAAEALRRSLNLPAVAVLDRVGPLRFAAALHAAGVDLTLPDGADASLPLALGGAGITLRQAAALYAALATDGAVMPLRLLAAAPAEPPRPLLPREAAVSVASVLTRPFPSGGPAGVAWKTGTSWGGRDAWALGFDARHVGAVWVGRPDGTPVPGATGAALALPLLARVLELLPPAPRPSVPGPAAEAALPPTDTTDTLRLLFPPPDAVLSADGAVTVRVMGGRRPLRFLVDGAPLPSEPAHRDANWTPSGPGFYRLTVLDAAGAAVRAAVRVR